MTAWAILVALAKLVAGLALFLGGAVAAIILTMDPRKWMDEESEP